MSKRITLTTDDIKLIERLLVGAESEISAVKNGKIYVIASQRIKQLRDKLSVPTEKGGWDA